MIGTKQPSEKVVFGFDFASDLGATTITTVATPAILPVTSPALAVGGTSNTDTQVNLRLDGGKDGESYTVTVTVTASDGQVFELDGIVQVAEIPSDQTDILTPAGFRAVFPAFASVPDAAITFWMTQAGVSVDTTWAEVDRDYAHALLTAHYLVTEGLGTGAEAQVAAAGMSGFRSVRSGTLSFDRGDAASSIGYATTRYGRQFLVIMRRNFSGPRIAMAAVIGGPCAPLAFDCDGPYFPYGSGCC